MSGTLVHIDEVTSGKETDYISGPNGTLARITNGVTTYLHPDILGSAQSGTNSSGVVQWREQYTPFGEEIQGIAANANQVGYTGHIRDDDTGLSYMQARYYDPVVGRFYSNDPVDMLGHMQPSNSDKVLNIKRD
ncbi:MAG: RHS repeat-associated domain protein [Idiomarinaceae bacterium HL-53]|nr:MAG: RHS repeat-associated domain protein [Idiomarinaceae bacterium HL-53]CUS47917.1 RHS repeat-associated core domain-containing protein [Idiomarinaceae bacterium HL-53]